MDRESDCEYSTARGQAVAVTDAIVAGLKLVRATISLGKKDTSYIASCCTQLDIREQDWVWEVKQCVDEWKSLYDRDALN